MVVLQGGNVPEFQIEPDPAKLLEAQVTVPGILDAVSKSNMIDSPGPDRKQSRALADAGQRAGARPRRDRQHRRSHHARRAAGADRRHRHGAPFRDAGVHHRHRERKAGRAAESLPAAGQQHRGRGGCRQPGTGSDPEDPSAGREGAGVLRSIHAGARFDHQRAGRDPDRPGSGGDHSGSVPARLGQFAGGRPGDSRHHRDHADRAAR